MKPIEIYSDKFLNRISILITVGGISLFPFIILREYHKGTLKGKMIVNHETIHFQQALELLVVPFYILYILEWVIKVLIYKFDIHKAYTNISFEREAYENQGDLLYIKNRKRYNWIKLL